VDPITVTKLVSDRTDDLQRTAEGVRKERALRSAATARAVAPPTRRAEARRSPASARDCAPAEPAV